MKEEIIKWLKDKNNYEMFLKWAQKRMINNRLQDEYINFQNLLALKTKPSLDLHYRAVEVLNNH